MALRDFFRGRRDRDEHTRYPLDPLRGNPGNEDSASPCSGVDWVSGSIDDEAPYPRAGSAYETDYFGSRRARRRRNGDAMP